MSNTIVAKLRDKDPDTQHRAALALYESGDLAAFQNSAEATDALRTSVAGENKTAAAVLLLGYDSSPAARELLQGILEASDIRLAKLQPWTVAVPLSLVATLSLARLGDTNGRRHLLEEIERGSFETLDFLLQVLRDIDDPTVLHALSRALDNEHPVTEGVPSGARSARRLADVAVEAFVKRLKLPVAFKLDTSRPYSEADVQEVKRLIALAIPR